MSDIFAPAYYVTVAITENLGTCDAWIETTTTKQCLSSRIENPGHNYMSVRIGVWDLSRIGIHWHSEDAIAFVEQYSIHYRLNILVRSRFCLLSLIRHKCNDSRFHHSSMQNLPTQIYSESDEKSDCDGKKLPVENPETNTMGEKSMWHTHHWSKAN